MFKPASLFIGLRYTRAKSRNQFISLISMISILGMALGITALITVLSVVNGFDREIKKQIFDMVAPITIYSDTGKMRNWQEIESDLKKLPEVTAIAPFITGQAMLTNSATEPAMLLGITPESENGISALSKKIIQGNLTTLVPGKYGIVIGKDLAKKLDVNIGDDITVTTLKGSSSSSTPRFKKFTVTGIFRAGGGALGFDSKMAFINLQDAQEFLSLGQAVSGLHMNIHDLYSAPVISQNLRNNFPPTIGVWDWTNQLGDFFENIRTTKTMMFLIFVLIIAVAAFNLICTMIMVVKNKHSDIAILRTLGATPTMILNIFIIQGLLIALGGTLLGIIGGVVLTYNVTALSVWLQNILHMELVSSNVYFVNYLPTELQWNDVWFISLVALVLSLLATLYPAWNASRIEPVEALNNE